mgnify:CR=1 FL=1
MTKKGFTTDFLIPFLVLLLGTMLFRMTDLDMRLAGLFYSRTRGWFLEDAWIIEFLHRLGAAPALIACFLALCAITGGFRSQRLSGYRKSAFYCLLVFAIGSGLVVNLLLKQHWGRPRPNQIVAFGGDKSYLPVWVKGDCRTCRSFPCGDASAGFFFLFLFFALRRRSPRAAAWFLLMGIAYGSLLGLCRMARGAHFASDVIWAGGIMYMSSAVFYYAFGLHLERHWRRELRRHFVPQGKPVTMIPGVAGNQTTLQQNTGLSFSPAERPSPVS